MIWLQLSSLFLSSTTLILAIYILRKQKDLGRNITETRDLFRWLVPRIEHLEKKLNIRKGL